MWKTSQNWSKKCLKLIDFLFVQYERKTEQQKKLFAWKNISKLIEFCKIKLIKEQPRIFLLSICLQFEYLERKTFWGIKNLTNKVNTNTFTKFVWKIFLFWIYFEEKRKKILMTLNEWMKEYIENILNYNLVYFVCIKNQKRDKQWERDRQSTVAN